MSSMIRQFRDWFSEPVVVLLVLLVSMGVGMARMFVTATPTWLRDCYTPPSTDLCTSVMVALGKGFVAPVYEDIPALAAFLKQEKMDLAPEELPEEIPTREARWWYKRHRYLMCAVGMVWRVCGFSWNAVKMLLVLLFCVTAAAVYGLFRLGMNRFVSAAGAILFMLSPGVLAIFPHLRDFGKAPFILSAMLVMGYLIRKPARWAVYLVLAVLIGVIVGIGIGFRHDVFICLFAGVFVLAFCPRPGRGIALFQRLAAILLLLVSFYASAWPVHRSYGGTGAPMHDIHMGLSTVCEDELGVGRASYERMSITRDGMVHATANSYARRVLGATDYLPYDSPGQEQARKRYFLEIVKTFPADLITRGYAAVLWVVRGAARNTARWSALEAHLDRFGLGYALAALMLIGCHSLHLGLMVLFLSFYFFGYITLQFQFRHCFHLAFVAIWIVAFLVDKVLMAACQVSDATRRREIWSLLVSPRRWWGARVRRALAFGGIAIVLILGPLYVARAWQQRQVDGLVARYRTADLEPLGSGERPVEDWVLFYPKGRAPVEQNGWQFCDGYVAADFEASTQPRAFLIQYETETGVHDFSHTVSMAPTSTTDAGIVRCFFPTYECTIASGYDTMGWRRGTASMGWSRFAGVALPAKHAEAFKGFYRVADSEVFPLWLHFSLPPEPALLKRHQTLPVHRAGCGSPPPPMAIGSSPWGGSDYGRFLTATGRPEEAIGVYEKALASDPMNVELLVNLGAALEANGEVGAAVETYNKAAAAAPDFYGGYFHLGKALVAQQDADGAIEAFRQAATLNPNDPAVQSNLAPVLAGKGDLEGAISAYREALALDVYNGRLEGELGAALEANGETDAAIAAFRKAGEYSLSDSDVQIKVAQALMRLGDFEDAVAPLCTALEVAPEMRSVIAPLLIEALCETGAWEAGWAEVAACRETGVEVPAELLARLAPHSGERE